MAIGTGDRAPHFDLQVDEHTRVALGDFLGRSNVLLVFHPLVFTPICTEEALDLEANLDSFRAANTEVVFVSCDSSAARAAWKKELGVSYTFGSDFWPHGAVAQAYGIFDETSGLPLRGTFLIDSEGSVVWSLVKGLGEKRDAIAERSLGTLQTT